MMTFLSRLFPSLSSSSNTKTDESDQHSIITSSTLSLSTVEGEEDDDRENQDFIDKQHLKKGKKGKPLVSSLVPMNIEINHPSGTTTTGHSELRSHGYGLLGRSRFLLLATLFRVLFVVLAVFISFYIVGFMILGLLHGASFEQITAIYVLPLFGEAFLLSMVMPMVVMIILRVLEMKHNHHDQEDRNQEEENTTRSLESTLETIVQIKSPFVIVLIIGLGDELITRYNNTSCFAEKVMFVFWMSFIMFSVDMALFSITLICKLICKLLKYICDGCSKYISQRIGWFYCKDDDEVVNTIFQDHQVV